MKAIRPHGHEIVEPGPPREPRTDASRNGRELRRDASDRDWTVWSLVADGGSKGKTATRIVSEIVGASEIGSTNGLRG
ncbi:hypothetical protein F2Q70_00044517 [Brassica cretica]|uniref:Uncharacterized protein n=1 Tax=Brassica cretica TaxID=69181 RepID=A0A8S9KH20_BRACR|nr:hypothetical protein F2Q70_00044517 [Brassica cretica]